MAKRKPTNKYYFSVEGETEQWYLKWLQDAINNTEEASCKQSGFGFWKKMNYLPRRNFRFRDITGFGYPATSSRQEKSEDFGDCICITVIF